MLGYRETSDAKKHLSDGQYNTVDRRIWADLRGRGKAPLIVTESGLYRLIMRSNRPEAVRHYPLTELRNVAHSSVSAGQTGSITIRSGTSGEARYGLPGLRPSSHLQALGSPIGPSDTYGQGRDTKTLPT
ncbi:BRO family protein [Pseudonocardia ailaonensis]|uniref:BRO family protein n=1 Tax=Pseudonocardia ailaonensis TaxID=367279 RepID=UPI003CD0AA0F